MRKQTVIFLLLLVASAFAARPWTQEEFGAFSRTYKPHWVPRPQDLVQGPRRYNYLQRVHLTCDFIRTYQVADSLSPDFGGIIEAEHMPGVIETDNTQEAVWVWSRWFQLTGDSTYRNNIRRAWTYVRSHAAYREHSAPQYLWYAIWNCGLGFMAEAEYRHTFGDSTFRAYGDTCRNFYLANPLPMTNSLDWFVTAQAAGMAYDYALDRGDAVLAETALARGTRVKAWIEQAPSTRLSTQNWAMCGGTAFWGVMNSVGRADTLAGRAWAGLYAESLPGFYPTGSWNCSHNIWLANAYRSAAERLGGSLKPNALRTTPEAGHDTRETSGVGRDASSVRRDASSVKRDASSVKRDASSVRRDASSVRRDASGVALDASEWWLMHQYLVDTLLTKDTDLDGGIPATWTDPNTMDQTWVSTYMDFMGMDPLIVPLHDEDLATLEFTLPDRHQVYIAGDTLPIAVPVANVGLLPRDGSITVTAPGYSQTASVPAMPLYSVDTLAFPALVAATPGIYNFTAAVSADDDPANDTVRLRVKVYGVRTITGTFADSTTGAGIRARLRASITGDATVRDSCETDSLGRFTLHIIDTTVTVRAEAALPYYNRAWNFTILGDTTLNLVSQTAHVCIVDNDSLSRYESYYTAALDTLELTYSVWNRRTDGVLPAPLLEQLRARTLIWYSGDTRTNTIPPEDRDSIALLGSRGVNVFITGQNIAEELQGTSFLANTIGCEFDSTGWVGFYAYGNRADSLGTRIPGTATGGGGGANNQTSRDVVTPLDNSSGFVVYDSVTPYFGGTRRENGAGRLVFLSFGFEAVNRPAGRPTFFSRPQLMGLILNWFSPGIGIEEGPLPMADSRPPTATVLRGDRIQDTGNRAELRDITGRLCGRLGPGAGGTRDLPAGVYFLLEPNAPARKIVITR